MSVTSVSPKLSLITVCYNSARTIRDTLRSVNEQSFHEIEYIVVDGGSTDGTQDIVRNECKRLSRLVSERDSGIYDAMNKGIGLATGDVIGFINSDDFYSGADAVSQLIEPFQTDAINISYGDLDYVGTNDTSKVVRDWRSGSFSQTKLSLGWMPPHPTFYAKKSLFEAYGNFDLRFRIAADYDLMIRFLRSQSAESVAYVGKKLVKMRVGGESNKDGLKTIFRAGRECTESAKLNGSPAPLCTATFKVLRKIWQLRSI